MDRLNPGAILTEAPLSLLYQSRHDPKRHQKDGWGVAWIDRRQPQVLKSPRPIYRDRAFLKRATRRAGGRALVAHVRWASNPLQLPKSELIGMPHTQPFVSDEWVFAHNGTLYIPREAMAHLGPDAKKIKGRNDSEVLFYWLMKYLKKPLSLGRGEGPGVEGVVAAIRASVQGLHELWRRCHKRYPLYRNPYHGLNWVLTNGTYLLTFCYATPSGFDQGKALCSRQPYFQLQTRVTPHQVTVTSEPLDQGTWQPMAHGSLLIAQRRGRRITVKVQKVL